MGEIPQVTLPIEQGLRLNAQEARALGDLLHEDYRSADPFPHIVIDDFLPRAMADRILEHFPVAPLESDVNFNIGYGGQFKRQVMPEDCDDFCREVFHFFNSAPILQFLEGLTGIPALLPDPYFAGGGFHETSRGGKLGIHADFRVNETLSVQRRLNLLVYLNPTWQEDWLGHLELWDKPMERCIKKVVPVFNRCVVFSTDADTWHGHPDPLNTPDGVTRRSMALYYYTASRSIIDEVPTMSTLYKARPDDPADIKAEAARFQKDQYLRQWLPPVVLRGVHKVGRGLKKLKARQP